MYIAEQSPESAARFRIAVRATFDDLGEFPHRGFPVEADIRKPSPRRTIRPRGYPNHVILYRVQMDHVEILDVYHGARNPRGRFHQG